jgi:ABC-2 type transport system ATP-binding protein
MKQRACLAKTLLHDPQVLLLDEPASGLDPRARIEFREILKELKRMGKTILVSSHILADLSLVCDSVGIIEVGKLVIAGGVKEILRGLRPHREFSLSLLDPDDAPSVQRLLDARGNVQKAEANGSGLRVSLVATDAEVAELLDLLVAEKVRLTGFHEESVDLEEAFMALTKGKLA